MQFPHIWKVVFLFCSGHFINHFIKTSHRQQVWTWYLSHQNKTPDYFFICASFMLNSGESQLFGDFILSQYSCTPAPPCWNAYTLLSCFPFLKCLYSQGISIKESWLHVGYVSVLCKHCVSPQTHSMSSSSRRWAAYSRLGTTSSAWTKCFCHSEPTNCLPRNAASPNSPLGCCQVVRLRRCILEFLVSVINSRLGW